MLTLRRINLEKSPRQIIFEDFDIDLPIKGGWGYELGNACVIDKNDHTVNKDSSFDGISIERNFVEKRIYEEMVILPEIHEQYAGIKWDLDYQQLIFDADKSYDKLVFNVEAFPIDIWGELLRRHEDIQQSGKLEQMDELNRFRDAKKIQFVCEFYFDITSFFGNK